MQKGSNYKEGGNFQMEKRKNRKETGNFHLEMPCRQPGEAISIWKRLAVDRKEVISIWK